LQKTLDDNNLEADFVATNRGGLITFHGPGQLVAYPILHLGDFKRSIPNKSVKAYVKQLENTIIDTLATVGLKDAHTVPEYPGVWLDNGDRKIAFIGISCKRYVTMHGISINCDCDLSWFDHIVSCGIENKAITSVRQEFVTHNLSGDKSNNTQCPNHGIQHIADAFCLSFAQHFDCDLREG
jgi:lipoyl(octanoyl) transferase